jgi:hypothetical protein
VGIIAMTSPKTPQDPATVTAVKPGDTGKSTDPNVESTISAITTDGGGDEGKNKTDGKGQNHEKSTNGSSSSEGSGKKSIPQNPGSPPDEGMKVGKSPESNAEMSVPPKEESIPEATSPENVKKETGSKPGNDGHPSGEETAPKRVDKSEKKHVENAQEKTEKPKEGASTPADPVATANASSTTELKTLKPVWSPIGDRQPKSNTVPAEPQLWVPEGCHFQWLAVPAGESELQQWTIADKHPGNRGLVTVTLDSAKLLTVTQIEKGDKLSDDTKLQLQQCVLVCGDVGLFLRHELKEPIAAKNLNKQMAAKNLKSRRFTSFRVHRKEATDEYHLPREGSDEFINTKDPTRSLKVVHSGQTTEVRLEPEQEYIEAIGFVEYLLVAANGDSGPKKSSSPIWVALGRVRFVPQK